MFVCRVAPYQLTYFALHLVRNAFRFNLGFSFLFFFFFFHAEEVFPNPLIYDLVGFDRKFHKTANIPSRLRLDSGPNVASPRGQPVFPPIKRWSQNRTVSIIEAAAA